MRDSVLVRVSTAVVVSWALLLSVLVWFMLRQAPPAGIDGSAIERISCPVEETSLPVAASPSPAPASPEKPAHTPTPAPRLESAAPERVPPPDLEGRVTFEVRTADGQVPERVLIKIWAEGQDGALAGGLWWDASLRRARAAGLSAARTRAPRR